MIYTGITPREPYYLVHIYDASSATLVAVYNNLTSLYYRKENNSPGIAILTVPEHHPILDLVEDDLLIAIYISYWPRSIPVLQRILWYKDFTGLYRGRQRATDAHGNIYHLLYFPGAMDALNRSIVAYPAGTTDRSQFSNVAIDVIIERIITYNCTSVGTTGDGRVRDVVAVRNFIFFNNTTLTTNIDFACAWRNVLEVVQELAALGGFDFIVEQQPGSPGVLACFVRDDPYGDDRSESIYFNMSLHNLGEVSLDDDRLREKTVAIVGGSGEGNARDIAIVLGPNNSANNDYELFVDAKGKDAAELQYIGESKMIDSQSRLAVDGSVIASLGYVYGRDYFLSDYVTILFGDVSSIKKIVQVEVNFPQSQASKIRLVLADIL